MTTTTGRTPAAVPAPGAARRRRGFTLTELLVSLVMFGLVSAIILGMVRSQQRFYRGATEVIDVRSQLRQAAALMPLELRSVSTVSTVRPAGSPFNASVLGSDVTYMSDKEIHFRATIGSGVICGATGNELTLVPHGVLARGNMLASWYSKPAPGDTVFIFDPGLQSGATDDQWQPFRIASVSNDPENVGAAAGLCTGAGANFVTAVGNSPAGDADKKNLSITVVDMANTAAVPATIGVGSVIRFTRSVGYGLYQSPTDGNKWYLGYKTVAGGTLAAPGTGFEPVSGPYNDWTAANGPTNGLALTYFDSTGAAIAGNGPSDRDRIARIDIVLRGSGTEVGNSASVKAKQNNSVFKDSLLLRVAIRNRS